MLVAKKTLLGPLLPWFTGCSAVLPGHLPFWASASISVPGAPASSLLTGSQVLASNPGVEIWAPVWVAVAVLCTRQPAEPTLDTSLAPVSDGELRLMPTVRTGGVLAGDTADCGAAWALDASQRSVVAATAAAAQRAGTRRMVRLIAGNSCLAVVGRERRVPPLNGQLVRILSKQTCQESVS